MVSADRRWSTTKRMVDSRENGTCLKCSQPGTDVHHRIVRGMGGTKNEAVAYGLANLILLCRSCHNWVHGHPTESYKLGFLVHSWDDPEEVPVVKSGARIYFRSDGTFERTGPCELFLYR